MPKKNTLTNGIARATLWLVIFQVIGLIIPLLTLPILARSLGVTSFGQIMLAQAVVFLGVVFVDAGFNTESQRRASLAVDSRESQQVLVDNFIARFVCSLPILLVILIVGFFCSRFTFSVSCFVIVITIWNIDFPTVVVCCSATGIKDGHCFNEWPFN